MTEQVELTAGPVFIDVASNVDGCELTDNAQTNLPKPTESNPVVHCSECQWKGSHDMIVRHIRKVHRGENPFQCGMCEYTAYNKTRFEEHINKHRGLKPYKCTHCPYKSVSKKYMKKHEAKHIQANPFKCQHCDHIARTSRALISHLKEHPTKNNTQITSNSPKTKLCEFCDKMYAPSDFKAHEVTRRICSHCSKPVCLSDYNRHMYELHGEPLATRVRSKKPLEEVFKCELCPWKGSVKQKVLMHLIHHPQQDVDEDVYDVSILRQCGIAVGRS